jgi:pimeloyl-ACP methyl ester carboxylesterase
MTFSRRGISLSPSAKVRKVFADDGRVISVVSWKPRKIEFQYPVVFIHGFGQNWLAWDGIKGGFGPTLAEHGFSAFSIDLRGSGFSRESGQSDFKIKLDFCFDDFVKRDIPAVLSYIFDVTEAKRAVLVGHSMGGTACYVFCSLNPDKVAGIVTLGSPLLYGTGVWPMRLGGFFTNLLRTSRLEKIASPFAMRLYFLKILGLLGILGAPLMRLRQVLSITPLYPTYTKNMGFDELIEKLTSGFEVVSPKLLIQIFIWAHTGRITTFDGGFAYSDLFPNISCPLFVITGKYDRLAPPESVKPILDIVASECKEYFEFDAGHLDLTEGDLARTDILPKIEYFLKKNL